MKKITTIVLAIFFGIGIGWFLHSNLLSSKFNSFTYQLQKEIDDIKYLNDSHENKRSSLETILSNTPDYVVLKSNKNKNLDGYGLSDWGKIGRYRIIVLEAHEEGDSNTSELLRVVKRIIFYDSNLNYTGYYPIRNFGTTYKYNQDSISINDNLFDLRTRLPDSIEIGPQWYLKLVK